MNYQTILLFLAILLLYVFKCNLMCPSETFELHQSLFPGTWRIRDLNFFSLLSAGSTVFSSVRFALIFCLLISEIVLSKTYDIIDYIIEWKHCLG